MLKSAEAAGQRLNVTIQDGDVEGSTVLEWDMPPSVADVERFLGQHIGVSVKKIAELDVPEKLS